eukprot:6102886-Pleurochrysis_carterae.AAC.6
MTAAMAAGGGCDGGLGCAGSDRNGGGSGSSDRGGTDGGGGGSCRSDSCRRYGGGGCCTGCNSRKGFDRGHVDDNSFSSFILMVLDRLSCSSTGLRE